LALTSQRSISNSENHSRNPYSVALKKCHCASCSAYRKAVWIAAEPPPGVKTRKISMAATRGALSKLAKASRLPKSQALSMTAEI
jgi:hypothetical protein